MARPKTQTNQGNDAFCDLTKHIVPTTQKPLIPMRWKQYLPFILIALFALLLLNQALLTPLIMARGDTFNYFYPYWHIRDQAFRLGELPLWTHHIFMGAPLWANPQIGTFYPLNWLSPLFERVTDSMAWNVAWHLIGAGWGVYVLMRLSLPEAGRVGATVAGILYAGGGVLTAHIEQVNQVQGLAWLGWLFTLYHLYLTRERRLMWALLLAMAWAWQIFSGHTQTVAIAGVGMGIYGIVWTLGAGRLTFGRVSRALGGLGAIAMGAGVLALPQLLPALELTGMSHRGGGFNAQEATAFSLSPLYLGRSLLPAYEGQLFSEYIGTLGILGLGAVVIGISTRLERADWRRWAWLTLIFVGFFFAFGRANPVYVALAEFPPFNLFRVPARWLAFWALGGAMLAGWGVHVILMRRRLSVQTGAILLALITGLMLVARFAPVDSADVVGSARATTLELGIWLVTLGAFVLTLWRRAGIALALFMALELFGASLIMPYNDLAPPEVFHGQRFTVSQLQAYAQDETAPHRYLAISPLYFDVGDRDALMARYADYRLNERAIRNAFVALKKQEVAFPNQSLVHGLHSVDGFGGGVLPTMHYSQFTSLILPENSLRTMDGRLGEMLALEACRGACVPELRWLDRMGVGYLITDKVFDVWHEDIAYDTHLARVVMPDETVSYQANAPLISDGVQWLSTGGTWSLMLDDERIPGERIGTAGGFDLWRVILPERDAIQMATLINTDAIDGVLVAVTLADGITGNFAMLTPGAWTRTLSSDIKIYARSDMPRRATVSQRAHRYPDTWQGSEDALIALRQLSPRDVILHTDDAPINANATGHADYIQQEATYLEIAVTSDAPSYLVLDVTWYPHWQATVNGEDAPVYRADVMFMAIPVPAGESVVTLTFEPVAWYQAGALGALAWLVALLALMLVRRHHVPRRHP